ncbi:MAG: OsmC family protein [Geminicoccaceae bacterium]
MSQLKVTFRSLHGTQATVGSAGVKSIVADRPKGVAGGLGLGLSGGELLALSIGAGFSNQLYFSADELEVTITELAIEVVLSVDNERLRGAEIQLALEIDGTAEQRDALLAHAEQHATISNGLKPAFPVTLTVL